MAKMAYGVMLLAIDSSYFAGPFGAPIGGLGASGYYWDYCNSAVGCHVCMGSKFESVIARLFVGS